MAAYPREDSARTGFTRRAFLRRSGLLVAGLAAGTTITGCLQRTGPPGGAGGEGGNTLERARQQGFIRVGFANEAPYGFADASGNLTGEAPEVARAVLAELGIEQLDGVLTEFGSLIPALQANRFDIIAAGMFVTPERCAEILFSDPDYCATQAFAVQKGNPLGLESYEDVAANPQARLGVLTGAVEGNYARSLGVTDSQINVLADPPSGIEALAADRVDAFALTSISIRNLLKTANNPSLELAGPFVPVIEGQEELGCGAYGFRKDDQEFRDAFNEGLTTLKESGAILPIVEPFGFTEVEVNASKEHPAEELCQG
jgi:ectoine/hydroxyectoine ABC transporter solute-binding protein